MKNMIESKIIKKEEDLNIITNKLKKIESFKNMDISYKLIYRGSRDGGLPKNFHEKCDGIKNTVTIIKTVKGLKFGGYINYKWDSNKGWIDDDENCFIFSLDLMKIYNPIKGKKKYLFSGTCGPNFTEFGLKNNLFEKSSLNMHKKDMANKFFSDFALFLCITDFFFFSFLLFDGFAFGLSVNNSFFNSLSLGFSSINLSFSLSRVPQRYIELNICKIIKIDNIIKKA